MPRIAAVQLKTMLALCSQGGALAAPGGVTAVQAWL
jgi:hypothetical protein